MWMGLVAMKTCSAGAVRPSERLDGGVDVLGVRPRQRGDGRLRGHARNGAYALEITGRGDREARLDHVHAEALELLCKLGLLVWVQRNARRLLAVPKRGVEDRDPAC